MRVLVIDNDHSVRAAIQLILERQGIETVLASDVHAGFQSFVSSDFDVVIVDIFMSGMNGLETIAGIRRRAPNILSLPCRASDFATPRTPVWISSEWRPSSAPPPACASRLRPGNCSGPSTRASLRRHHDRSVGSLKQERTNG